MTDWIDSFLEWSAVAECGARLLDPVAAWVFSRDGSRALWANAAGGKRLGFASFAALHARGLPDAHPLRRDLVHIWSALGPAGSLGRLRLLGAPLACRCMRLRGPSGERALLVVALDAGDPKLAGPEAAAGFLSGGGVTAALLRPDGTPLDPQRDGARPDAWRELARRAAEGPPVRRDGEGLAAVAVAGAAQPLILLFHPASATPAGPVRAAAPVHQADAAEAPGREDRAARPESFRRPADAALLGPVPQAQREADAAGAGERAMSMRDVRQGGASPGERGVGGHPGAGRQSRLTIGSEAHLGAAVELPAGQGSPAPRDLPKKPVRFLWQTDAAERILFVSPGLAQTVGRTADIVGEKWRDAASRLSLDPTGRVSRALAQRDTWSGLTAWWPVEGSPVRVPAELTALPVFGVDGSFQGYRGFGVLKPAEALLASAFEARFGRSPDERAEAGEPADTYEEGMAFAPTNVVPIRADMERMPDFARLSPQERVAFEEIAAALGARIVDAPPRSASHDPAHPPAEPAGDAAAPADAAGAPDDMAGHGAPSGAPGSEPSDERHEPLAAPDGADASPDAALEQPDPAHMDAPPAAPPGAPQEPDAGPGPERVAADVAPAPAGETAPAAAQEMPDAPAAIVGDGEADGAVAHNLVPSALYLPDRPVLDARPATPARDPDEAERPDAAGTAERADWLDAAPAAFVVLDADGRIDSMNAAAEELLDVGRAEATGRFFADLLTPASRAVALQCLERVRACGAADADVEIEALSGGRVLPLALNLRRHGEEPHVRVVAILRDMAPWRQAEAELEAAREALQEVSRAKARFVARVAEEIRAPLSAIVGFAEVMIEERFGPIGDERYRQHLRDIRTSAEHVIGLVGDLVGLSETEAGTRDLEAAPVPLNDVVRDGIALLQPQANRAQVILRSSLSDDVPAVLGDPRTLRQAIHDLLSDAVRGAGAGRQVIASTMLTEAGEAVLRVRHTGEGLSEEELKDALQPFRSPPGDGGEREGREAPPARLSLTKALVEANRARFSIRSALGEGTIASVAFPATRVLSE